MTSQELSKARHASLLRWMAIRAEITAAITGDYVSQAAAPFTDADHAKASHLIQESLKIEKSILDSFASLTNPNPEAA